MTRIAIRQTPSGRMTSTGTLRDDDDYDPYWDYDESDCWQCGGEGYVYGCSWDWQCDTWDGDSCLCTRRCDVCNPAPHDPELQRVLGEALSAPIKDDNTGAAVEECPDTSSTAREGRV